MEYLLYYLLRASLSMALFYGFYKLFLGKNTFHAINRFVLIAIAVLTLFLPLFRFNVIPVMQSMTVSDHPSWELTHIPVSDFSSMTATEPVFPWSKLFLVLFAVGFLFALGRYLIGLFQLIALIRESHQEKLPDGTTLCMSAKEIAPFSWMNYVVLNGKDIPEQHRVVIRHEQAHVRLHHSFDMILFDLFTSLFWFNPFSWLLRREIQSVHEYQADAQVLNEGVEIKQYQLLLIRKSVGEQKFALANNFRQRDLHKRIQMMMKKSSDKQMKWRYTAAIPSLFLVMVALSVPKLNASIPEKAIEQSLEMAVPEGDTIVFSDDIVAKSNGSIELRKVRIVTKDDSIDVAAKVGDQPDTTRAQGMKTKQKELKFLKVIGYGSMNDIDSISMIASGGVGAQPLFILDGKEVESISDIDPELIETIDVLKQHAAEEFGERGKEGVIIITTKKDLRKTFDFYESDKPLLILDGVIQEAAFDLQSVSPHEIESMEVIKGNRAVDLYGEKGKNGVILIYRKRSTN